MSESAHRKRGGIAFQSVLSPHFDFIRELRRRRKTWREIAELLATEKGIQVCLHTAYYFYRRRLKRLASQHWEDVTCPDPARKQPSVPSSPILAVTPPQREFRRPNPQGIKLNDPTKL